MGTRTFAARSSRRFVIGHIGVADLDLHFEETDRARIEVKRPFRIVRSFDVTIVPCTLIPRWV